MWKTRRWMDLGEAPAGRSGRFRWGHRRDLWRGDWRSVPCGASGARCISPRFVHWRRDSGGHSTFASTGSASSCSELRRVLNFTGRIFPSMAASVAIRLFSKVRIALGCCLVLGVALPCRSMAADPEALKADAEEFFRGRVTPFIQTYCIDCHQNKRPTQAGVNFSPALKDPGHPAFTEQWKKAAARVKAHAMPPKGMPQPS